MKIKSVKSQSHYRIHHRSLLYMSVALLLLCMYKFDSRFVVMFRQTYTQGFGIIGTYMREGEMTRFPVDFGVTSRVQTMSGL